MIQVASICEQEYLWGEIYTGSVVAVLAEGFFSGEISWGPVQNGSLGTTVIPCGSALLLCSWLFAYLIFADFQVQ